MAVACACLGAAAKPALRVCADPNNMPFSNAKAEGFENRIASLVAREMHQRLEYVWSPQRRGLIRMTLNAGRCDVVMGVPARYGRLQTGY
jgi:mxaJ protein